MIDNRFGFKAPNSDMKDNKTADCRDCGKQFQKPATRGRPPVKCAECRGVKQQIVEPPAPPLWNPKGVNGLYSRAALIEYLDANPGPYKPQELAAVIRSLI